MTYLFPLLLLAAAAAMTYLCCIRPMRMRRDGSCHLRAPGAATRPAAGAIEVEIHRLREEAHLLRRELDAGSAQSTPGGRDSERR